MTEPFANGPDRLAYYRQQAAIALQQVERSEAKEDREVWARIAEEWQRLHDSLAREIVDLDDPKA